jgi:mannose/fructose/N-acetylgalactosamine-specific phosphotransferase system component IIB
VEPRGLHYAPGKSKVDDYVYLDEADREDARALARTGCGLIVQDVPATRPETLAALDPSIAS